jgi:hypothetical protein
MLLALGSGAGVVMLTGGLRQIPWPILIVIAAAMVATEWFVLRAITPPTLKADAMEVSSIAPLATQRMPRADVRLICRGQIQRMSRNGKYWDPSYAFVRADGTFGLTCSASGFADAGVVEFAQRLGVPIRGDLSDRLNDRVDQVTA